MPSPGSRCRFVIRTSGIRLQPSARIEPPRAGADPRGVSREVRKPIEHAGARRSARARAGTPSSSKPNVPSPPGVVASAVTFMSSEP